MNQVLRKDSVIGGVFCGREIAQNLFAEEVANGRWVVRIDTGDGWARRIGEVMGCPGRYQAMLMSGKHVGMKPSLLAAAQLLKKKSPF